MKFARQGNGTPGTTWQDRRPCPWLKVAKASAACRNRNRPGHVPFPIYDEEPRYPALSEELSGVGVHDQRSRKHMTEQKGLYQCGTLSLPSSSEVFPIAAAVFVLLFPGAAYPNPG